MHQGGNVLYDHEGHIWAKAVGITNGLAISSAGDLSRVALVGQANGTKPCCLVLQGWQVKPVGGRLIQALATHHKLSVQRVLVVCQQAVVLIGSTCRQRQIRQRAGRLSLLLHSSQHN